MLLKILFQGYMGNVFSYCTVFVFFQNFNFFFKMKLFPPLNAYEEFLLQYLNFMNAPIFFRISLEKQMLKFLQDLVLKNLKILREKF